ncbi:MAG: hypothetical protein QGG42_13675 [Phycisphaerae bacterium]|jgi:hypothetical protein|nr:hypothetical protein [Phycisphaerae bacterium]
MKKFIVFTASVLVVSIVSGSALGLDQADRKRRSPRQRGAVAGQGKMGKLLESFNLSEEELARVRQIFDTRRQADANWKKENAEDFKDIRDAMTKAKEAGDSAAMRAAGDRMRKLMASRKNGLEDIFVQLSEILSKEQLAKAKLAMSPQKSGPNSYLFRPEIFNAALAKLDLTDEQKTEIKKIQAALKVETDKARAAMKEAKTRQEKSEIMKGLGQASKEAWDKIKAILGEELAAKLQQITGEMAKKAQRQRDPFAGVDLTDGQKKKISAIRQSVREKMRNAQDGEAKRALITEMRKEIDAVLTDEQKVQLKEQMSKRRKAYSQSKRRRDQPDKE